MTEDNQWVNEYWHRVKECARIIFDDTSDGFLKTLQEYREEFDLFDDGNVDDLTYHDDPFMFAAAFSKAGLNWPCNSQEERDLYNKLQSEWIEHPENPCNKEQKDDV